VAWRQHTLATGDDIAIVRPRNLDGACSSVGEHLVDIEGVASSILATPTIWFVPSFMKTTGCRWAISVLDRAGILHIDRPLRSRKVMELTAELDEDNASAKAAMEPPFHKS
jgi:hypothetical protein